MIMNPDKPYRNSPDLRDMTKIIKNHFNSFSFIRS